ncbi:YbjN domain-containing protein [Sodalis ligni]|uniref:YbjN domain-containing protein n=1 Tax=Sodalis ligni TaxID=2697027 RepID=UPI00193FAD18|nr:YbjN domain-containing protein [Sodalis ligni]QWA10731.1 YbjN domain-containing protein [Sodalis ligni]
MNEPALIENVTVQLLTDLLQGAGYRTNESEQGGIVQLLSASQGIGFAVRFGNPSPEPGTFLDFTLSCALRVNGALPSGLVEKWNQSKRFSRLSEQGGFLVLEMDVVVAGGVNQRYLRASIELWDRLLQEFLLYLRTFSAAPQPGKAKESAAAADGNGAETAERVDAAKNITMAGQLDAEQDAVDTDIQGRKTYAADDKTNTVAL